MRMMKSKTKLWALSAGLLGCFCFGGGGRLILQDYTAPKLILWLMNHTEMPLANLIGHGDVAARSPDEIRGFCDAAGLKVEKLERAKKFRLHLVARKPTIEKRREHD